MHRPQGENQLSPACIHAHHPQNAGMQELTGRHPHCSCSALLSQVSSLQVGGSPCECIHLLAMPRLCNLRCYLTVLTCWTLIYTHEQQWISTAEVVQQYCFQQSDDQQMVIIQLDEWIAAMHAHN